MQCDVSLYTMDIHEEFLLNDHTSVIGDPTVTEVLSEALSPLCLISGVGKDKHHTHYSTQQ